MKLNQQDVHKIRSLYHSGELSQVELAQIFEVSQPLISKIVRGQIYKNDSDLVISGSSGLKVGYKHGD